MTDRNPRLILSGEKKGGYLASVREFQGVCICFVSKMGFQISSVLGRTNYILKVKEVLRKKEKIDANISARKQMLLN